MRRHTYRDALTRVGTELTSTLCALISIDGGNDELRRCVSVTPFLCVVAPQGA